MSQPDLGALFEKARVAQEKLQELQQELATRQVEGSAGGGMVTAVATGGLRIVEIHNHRHLLAELSIGKRQLDRNRAADRSREVGAHAGREGRTNLLKALQRLAIRKTGGETRASGSAGAQDRGRSACASDGAAGDIGQDVG